MKKKHGISQANNFFPHSNKHLNYCFLPSIEVTSLCVRLSLFGSWLLVARQVRNRKRVTKNYCAHGSEASSHLLCCCDESFYKASDINSINTCERKLCMRDIAWHCIFHTLASSFTGRKFIVISFSVAFQKLTQIGLKVDRCRRRHRHQQSMRCFASPISDFAWNNRWPFRALARIKH